MTAEAHSLDFLDAKSRTVLIQERTPYLNIFGRGYKKLDTVALTHAHQDYIGGLSAILNNFHVGRLWIGREVSSVALANLEQLAREKKIPIVHEMRGNRFSWEGVEGLFLWPEISPEEIGPSAKTTIRLYYGYGTGIAASCCRGRRKAGGA